MREHRPGYGVTIAIREERARAAGLFEGEGCFTFHRHTKASGRSYQYPKAAMNMTDEDVIRRFHSVIGIGTVTGPRPIKGHPERKDLWYWSVAGHQNTQFVLILLWEWLCSRRRARAIELLHQPLGLQP